MSQLVSLYKLPNYDISSIESPQLQDSGLSNIISDIINNNTYEEIVDSLNNYYSSSIHLLNDLINSQIGHVDKFDAKAIEELIEKDYNAYEEIKTHVNIRTKPIDIKRKLTELIDNLFDYENIMTGIFIHKTKNYEEQKDKLDINDLKKNIVITILLFYGTLKLFFEDTDNDKIRLFLDIALKYSEILQSYADTLDELTS